MATLPIPFQPMRSALYNPDELFGAFHASDPVSYLSMQDFKIYQYFVKEGRSAPANYFTSMMQALHDNSITQTLSDALSGKKCVAIMGGHKLGRSTPEYHSVAKLSARLTRSGFFVASGGGPGAMEATHLGAASSAEDEKFLDAAILSLKAVPDLPANIAQIVGADGTPDKAVVTAAHAWLAPAMKVMSTILKPGASLAVPTWHYGHEPTSPFATHIAKYFQNSIREDGLLAIAHDGIVYAQGKAGTIQEIFQDAAQNYYKSFGRFSPMVFLGKKYWEVDFPVLPVLQNLFKPEDFAKYVLATDSVDEAHDFLVTGHS